MKEEVRSVEEQQQGQLNQFIEVAEEALTEDKVWQHADFISNGSVFFEQGIGYLINVLYNIISNFETAYAEHNNASLLELSNGHMKIMHDLLLLCKQHPDETLSGKYPGGGVMEPMLN